VGDDVVQLAGQPGAFAGHRGRRPFLPVPGQQHCQVGELTDLALPAVDHPACQPGTRQEQEPERPEAVMAAGDQVGVGGHAQRQASSSCPGEGLFVGCHRVHRDQQCRDAGKGDLVRPQQIVEGEHAGHGEGHQ
jgi:hypothetical protein